MKPGAISGRKTRTVIVGGGAAGLGLATKLGGQLSSSAHEVVLIDRSPTHIWKPLLHEVAAGVLDATADEVSYQIHGMQSGYVYLRGELCAIDAEKKVVHLSPIADGHGRTIAEGYELEFDYLVLAIGSITNDFGTPGVDEYCLTLDSRAQADACRNLFHQLCLRVSRGNATDPERRARVLIVGAGATGVELAGELRAAAVAYAELGLYNFDASLVEIVVLERGERILPGLSDRLAGRIMAEFAKADIGVVTGVTVTSVGEASVWTEAHGQLPADLCIWAAGVKGPAELLQLSDSIRTSRGKFQVRKTLQLVEHDFIFAIGDCAEIVQNEKVQPVPPRAQAAHQMSDCVYENLRSFVKGRDLTEFVYRDYGSIVSLGHGFAAGAITRSVRHRAFSVSGRLGRCLYNSLYHQHLLSLYGWRRGIFMLATKRAARMLRPRLKPY